MKGWKCRRSAFPCNLDGTQDSSSLGVLFRGTVGCDESKWPWWQKGNCTMEADDTFEIRVFCLFLVWFGFVHKVVMKFYQAP